MAGATTTPVTGSPTRLVEGVADVKSVVTTGVGGGTSLALRGDGSAFGWGNNFFGALQQPLLAGSLVITSSPVPLDTLGAASQLHACDSSLALRGDGTVWMLPASASTTAVTARQINGLAGVARLGRSVLTPPSMATCELLAIDQTGAAKTVELTRSSDGAGGLVTRETVRDVNGLPPVKQAHCGGTDANNRFCVALDFDGRVWTVGGAGLLGDGTTSARTNWAMLAAPTDVESIEITAST